MTNQTHPLKKLISATLADAETVYMMKNEADSLADEVVGPLGTYLQAVISTYAATARTSGCVESIREAGDPDLAQAVGEHYANLFERLCRELTGVPSCAQKAS